MEYHTDKTCFQRMADYTPFKVIGPELDSPCVQCGRNDGDVFPTFYGRSNGRTKEAGDTMRVQGEGGTWGRAR
jgi:hypothetical protein